MQSIDSRIYKTFEEFEREELRRTESIGVFFVEDMFDPLFGELDFDPAVVRRSAWDEEQDVEE